MALKQYKPLEIEKESFAIITKELGDRAFPKEHEMIIKRVIHTTADFEYADSLYFTSDAITSAHAAIAEGATIVTDTNMALSGINKQALGQLGLQAICYMADKQVAAQAKVRETTRAAVSMEHAAELSGNLIFAIGNAPTALIRLHALIAEGKLRPKLVIGVPVGFVNVVESKELFYHGNIPCILSRGRKGGSTVAAAIVNAMMYELTRQE